MCFPGLADAALGEGTGVKLHKLSVREIKAVRSFILLSYISPIHVISQLFGMGPPQPRAPDVPQQNEGADED